MIVPKKALQKPLTTNDGITWETKSNNSELITTIKSPMVTMIKGRLKRSKMGRTKAFIIPSKRDAPIRAPQLSQWIPGISLAAKKTAMVVTNQRIRKALIFHNLQQALFF